MLRVSAYPAYQRNLSFFFWSRPQEAYGRPAPVPTPQPKLCALSVGTQGTWTNWTIYPSVSKASVMCLSLTRLGTALGQGRQGIHLCVSGFCHCVTWLLTVNIFI